ncbi:MAG: DUF1998 domain-containing protein [Polyangiaceae bacterium]|nr:DUF1998 domain-containing protein [Polyangiaceae bacterium]
MKERPHPSHPDLGHGCTLAIDPSAENVQLAHLRSALSEAEKTEEELNADFSPALVAETLAQLKSDSESGLLERRRKVIETATGEAKTVCTFRLSTPLTSDFATRAAGEPARVIDRHTGDILFAVERERALAAAYPGRVFVRQKKRFCVLPFEEQDASSRGEIACEREERLITTSKIRSMEVATVERRSGGDRRSARDSVVAEEGSSVNDRRIEDRRSAYQRAAAARTLGGVSFSLRTLPVNVTEHVLGFRRFDLNGLVRDTTLYPEPITCSFSGKATLMGFPASSFSDVNGATLHALAHLFRTTLGAFLHHTEEDVDVVWLPSFGSEKEPSIAFVDLPPGGAGFAEGCSLDVLRACVRWSLALVRRCPGGCGRTSGCLFCIQIRDCHSAPDDLLHLDKAGADRVLSLLVGEQEAKRFDAPTKGAP